MKVDKGADAFATLRRNRTSRWSAHKPEAVEGTTRTRLKLLVPRLSPKFSISKSDTVFTMGSCFARNIEIYLERFGYQFGTRNPDYYLDKSECTSANGYFNKFTVPSMMNEVAFAAGERVLPETAYIHDETGRWQDGQSPATFASFERAKEIRDRIEGVTKPILKADVVMLTLGLVEAWYDNENQIYWNLAPPASILKSVPDRFSLHTLSYIENRKHLETLYETVRRHNPSVKMVVTVSPVPLAATLSGLDIVLANTYSKSTLRAVASDFAADHANVDYFPSYEMALEADPLGVWMDDAIHVRDQMVECIITHFLMNYLPEEDRRDLSLTGPKQRLSHQIQLARSALVGP